MISVMKNICIFMVTAQMIVLLVPANSYMKYVKLLIGILMIFMILQPVLSWVSGKEGVGLEEVLAELERELPALEMQEAETGDNKMGIYNSIEEEIKDRLNEACGEKCEIREVKLIGAEDKKSAGKESQDWYLQVTVGKRKEEREEKIQIDPILIEQTKQTEKEKNDALKQEFGACISIDPERIEIKGSYE